MPTIHGHRLVPQGLHGSAHEHCGPLKPSIRFSLPQGQGHSLHEKGHAKNFLEVYIYGPNAAFELREGQADPLPHVVMESQSSRDHLRPSAWRPAQRHMSPISDTVCRTRAFRRGWGRLGRSRKARKKPEGQRRKSWWPLTVTPDRRKAPWVLWTGMQTHISAIFKQGGLIISDMSGTPEASPHGRNSFPLSNHNAWVGHSAALSPNSSATFMRLWSRGEFRLLLNTLQRPWETVSNQPNDQF